MTRSLTVTDKTARSPNEAEVGRIAVRRRQVSEVLERIWPDATWSLSPASSEALQEQMLRWGLLLAGLGLAVQSVLHLVNVIFFGLDVDFINADSDTGAFSWFSVAAEFAAALAAFLLGVLLPRARAGFFALSAVCAFFSADDMLTIHERLTTGWTSRPGLPAHFGRMIWPAVFFPSLVLAFLLLWTLALKLRPRLGAFVRWGLGLLVAAIVLEVASSIFFAVGFDHGDLPYELEVVVEEGAELVGWILIAAALFAATVGSIYTLGARSAETSTR